MNYEQAKNKLSAYGQEHVLKYYDELNEEQKEMLLAQIEDTDFSVLKYVKEEHKVQKGEVTPLAAMHLLQIKEK